MIKIKNVPPELVLEINARMKVPVSINEIVAKSWARLFSPIS
jgi:hypothetical protein